MTSPVRELRPMAMGELIDRAATFWRTHLKAMFKISLGFQVAQYVILKAYLFATMAWSPLMRNGQKMMEAARDTPGELLRQWALGFAGLALSIPIYLAITWLAGVAITRYTMPTLLGRATSPREALRHTLTRVGPVTGGFVLSLLWLAGISLVLVLPGAAGVALAVSFADRGNGGAAAALAVLGVLAIGFGVLVAMVWYLLRFFLTSQVIAMEELGAVAAVRRSGALVAGRIGPGVWNLVKMRASLLISVMALIVTAVGLVSGLPEIALTLAYPKQFSWTNPDLDSVPQALLIPAELLQVVVQSAIGPLYVVFGVLFYLDMRVRREGLDLEARLDALGPVGP